MAWGEGSEGRGVGARGPCQGGVRDPTVILREGMAILRVFADRGAAERVS